MKTTLTLSLFLIFFNFSTVFGQTVIWEDDFEGGFGAGWTHWSTNWGASQVWSPSAGNGVNGSDCIVENWGPYFAAVSNWTQAPAVDLSNAANPTLEFDLAMGRINAPNHFSVWYSTGGNWNLITSYGGPFAGADVDIPVATAADNQWTPQAGDWNTYTIDISQFIGQSNIRFSFGADFLDAHTNAVWFLDNVKVVDNPTSVSVEEEFAATSFSTFPNPAQNTLNITTSFSDFYDFSIVDLTGRVIIEHDENSGNAKIDISTLPTGIYILQLEANGKTITEKFVKN